MSQVIIHKTRQFGALTLVLCAALLSFFAFANRSQSASPTGGTLNPAGPTVTWIGTAAGGASLDESTCTPATCDSFNLTLSGTPADWVNKKAHIKISWPYSEDDFDVFVHKGTVNGPVVASSAAGGAGPEEVDLDPSLSSVGTGQFVVRVVYWLVVPTDSFDGEASVISTNATPTPTPSATPTPTPAPAGLARFHTFAAPQGVAEDAGEPSIGSNWTSENVVRAGSGHTFANSNGPVYNGGTTTYYGGFLLDMLRITFDDCSSPANAYWEQKPLTLAATPRALGDPILFTDHVAGRTWVMQEEAQAGATTDITDNDGESFSPSTGSGPPAGVDHETQASGPYAGSPPPTALWPSTGAKRAVYYAAQSVSDARISRSDDGGVTFGPAIPMYTTVDCGGLHGHIKVTQATPATLANGHAGTVYVPNNACGGTSDPVGHVDGQQAVIVSEDNGITWHIRPIPGSDTKSDRDPSVGIATDGTIYVGMQSADGHARVAVSHDKGITWSTPYDVGAQLGINNMVFAEVVAGDGDELGLNKGRAAFSFFGTTTADGPLPYDDPSFPGVWYLFVSVTYDSGQTWTTINLTPGDPIQRGGICGSGTCRNLLDFYDATIDKRGRVLIGWEDGCIGGCVNGGANSFTAKATISRQSGGKRMYAAYDPVEPAIPGAPGVTGNATPTTVQLSWDTPDNGGQPIIGYNIYRKAGSLAPFVLIATVNTPGYTDTTFNNALQNSYRVTALNAQGEGPFCKDFIPGSGPVQSACVLPGIKLIDDTNADGSDADSGQNTPADGRVNVKQVYVGEPFVDVATKNFLHHPVAPSTTNAAPPNSQWLLMWNRQGTQPSDPNDAKYDRIYLAMVTDVNGAPSFRIRQIRHPDQHLAPAAPRSRGQRPRQVRRAR